MQDVLLYATEETLEHKREGNLPEEHDHCYWELGRTPKKTEPGRQVLFANEEQVIARAEIIEIGDCEVRFEPLEFVREPLAGGVEPVKRNFRYIDPARRIAPHDRKGPIVFSNERAREQLLRGRVVSFRPKRRTVGETHARWERTGSKMADVVVKEGPYVDSSDPDALLDARQFSGFEAVEEWQAAIEAFHGDLPEGWLYDVVLLDTAEGVERTGDLGYEHAGEWGCPGCDGFVATERADALDHAFACGSPVDGLAERLEAEGSA